MNTNIEVLRGLVAKWRADADGFAQLAETSRDSVADLAVAGSIRDNADELEAAISEDCETTEGGGGMSRAIWLVTLDGVLHVKIENEHGAWVTVIREAYDGGPISHVVEPSGIAAALAAKAPQAEAQVGGLTEQQKADRDAVMYGTGFMLGGKHIPAQDVMIVQAPQQPEAQAGAWVPKEPLRVFDRGPWIHDGREYSGEDLDGAAFARYRDVAEAKKALTTPPPSAVPEGWREFIQDCALNRDGVHDAAQRSARAIALLAAAKQKEGDHG